jgi:hypothetical protein
VKKTSSSSAILALLLPLSAIHCSGPSGKAEATGGAKDGGASSGGREASGGGTGSRVCSSGETQRCVGPGACEGGQECQADGMGWAKCDCGQVAGSGGEGGSGAGSGGEASTGGTAGSGPEACDPLASQPCGPSERCTWIGSKVQGAFACAAEGNQMEGEPCGGQGQQDACAAGLGCGAVDTCQPFCELGSTPVCSDAGPCVALTSELTVGTCEPACDPIAQDCGENRACIPAVDGAYCVNSASKPLGLFEECESLNQCEPGLVCLGLDQAEVPATCRKLCDTTSADIPCGSEPTCFPGEPCGSPPTCLPLDFVGFSGYPDLRVGLCSSVMGLDVPAPGRVCGGDEDCLEVTAGIGHVYACKKEHCVLDH